MIKHIFKLIWNKKGSNALMLLEIFLSFLVLFAVVGYVLYNVTNIKTPIGFETEDRWIVHIDDKIYTKDSLDQVLSIQSLKTELENLQEVEQVTFLQNISPFSNNNWVNDFEDKSGLKIMSNMFPTDNDFDEVMGINILQGRWYNEGDHESTHIPILVNKIWQDKHYEGHSVLDSTYTQDGKSYKVIGVVDHNKYLGEFREEVPTIYMQRQYHENRSNILMKMKSETPATAEEKIAKTIKGVLKSSGSVIASLDKKKELNTRYSWMIMIALLSICGFLCINVALGLFGVLSYNINKRRAEIGLRQAIGAHGYDITLQFILEILILTALAVGLGIFFAIQIPILDVTEYPDSLFYKAIVYSALIIVALVVACALIPGLQAAKIRPATALHETS